MTKKIKVGVIGLGMGRGHISGYREHENADVVAIADLNQELLDKRWRRTENRKTLY